MTNHRILVTTKGETGYLHTEIDLSLRTRYSVTLDAQRADTFSSRAQAERFATKAAAHFDHTEIEEAR